jgi:putative (di)nucleoside polyphosphate hydrolase
MNIDLYRSCVGIAVINNKKQLFVAERKDTIYKTGSEKRTLCWQMPQGGIELNESVIIAAKRELKEETNISSTNLIDSIDEWLFYDIPKEIIPKHWHNKYIGQKQKWFLMEFTGNDAEINIHGLDAEFTSWRWLEASELLANTIPFKRDIYKKVLTTFKLI